MMDGLMMVIIVGGILAFMGTLAVLLTYVLAIIFAAYANSKRTVPSWVYEYLNIVFPGRGWDEVNKNK